MSESLTYQRQGAPTRDQVHTLFAQTMGYVAATAGLFALGAYLDRNMVGVAWTAAPDLDGWAVEERLLDGLAPLREHPAQSQCGVPAARRTKPRGGRDRLSGLSRPGRKPGAIREQAASPGQRPAENADEVTFDPAHLPAARPTASRSYGAQRHPTERKGLP